MENRKGYDPSEFEDDDYMNPQPDAGKSIRGYRIVIIILSVILVAISVLIAEEEANKAVATIHRSFYGV